MKKVNDLKEAMRSHSEPYALGFIEHYPELPSLLPKAVQDAGYDVHDPLIQRYIKRYEMIGRHVPLRKSSRLLNEEEKAKTSSIAPMGADTPLSLGHLQQIVGLFH